MIESGSLDDVAAAAEASSSVPTLLMSRLYSAEALTRWRAAEAMGRACEVVGRREPGKVRQVLQRLVWALNDESGTTGWGVPQAIGEVIRTDRALAQEFAPMLIAYLEDEDVAVGTGVLVHGVVHALGRIGERHEDAVKPSVPALRALLGDSDATTRGLAVWALGKLRAADAAEPIARMCGDDAVAQRYEAGQVVTTTVGEIAKEALAALRG